MIVGEWDRNTPPSAAQAVHALLTHAASKELVVLPEATHIAVLEKNREALIGTLAGFLTAQGALAVR